MFIYFIFINCIHNNTVTKCRNEIILKQLGTHYTKASNTFIAVEQSVGE